MPDDEVSESVLIEGEQAGQKWWEDRVDEMFVGLIVGAISITAIFVLKDKCVPIVSSAVSVCGMYMVGKPRNGG